MSATTAEDLAVRLIRKSRDAADALTALEDEIKTLRSHNDTPAQFVAITQALEKVRECQKFCDQLNARFSKEFVNAAEMAAKASGNMPVRSEGRWK